MDAVGVGVDADAVEAETIDPRTPAGGDEQVVTAQLTSVLELQSPSGHRLWAVVGACPDVSSDPRQCRHAMARVRFVHLARAQPHLQELDVPQPTTWFVE